MITQNTLIISSLHFANNLQEKKKSQIDANIKVVGSLADSVDMLQAEVIDLSTYICINNEVNKILTADNAEILNRDARLWLNDAPMQMIQDMIALKGYIKTIAIYPENGVQPYLRCIDSSSYIQEMKEIRKQEIYRKAIEQKGKVIWQKVSKESKDTYQANRNDKIVLYRELFVSTKRKQLGYIVIGMSSEKITDLCVNAVQHDTEGILIVSFDGSELTRYG